MTNNSHPLQSYVRAALELQGYAFSDERVAELTAQFARIAAIAETLPPAAPTLGDVSPAPGGPAPGGRLPAAPAPVFRP